MFVLKIYIGSVPTPYMIDR